jgi:acyl phosphate:glycerol-3-phosphate acyltransferase
MPDNVIPFALLFTAVIAYLLGSIPFGLLLTRAAGLGDIRRVGSGSIGATNVLRTGRKGLAAGTLLLDAAKGALAVVIGWRMDGTFGVMICGLAVVVGHMYPLWLNFRGGKGVATGLGVLLAASPLSAAAAGAVWLVMALTFRISSAASLAACAAAPVLVALITRDPLLLALSFVISLLIWIRHGANLRRLIAGTEPRIGAR